MILKSKKVCGIVAEYNPFHLGHQEQIRILKENYQVDYIIAIMSGHFLQRGIPSVIDKWTRAKMAVQGGVDLVLELPVRFSLSSSDDFSEGAVSLLSSIGVNQLCFGSEKDHLSDLSNYAKIICQNPTYDDIMYENIKKGNSYVKANEIALTEIYKKKVLLSSNALLGLSYLKAIYKNSLNIKALPIERKGASFLDKNIDSDYPSAEAIRLSLYNHIIDWKGLKKSLPIKSYEAVYGYSKYIFEDDFYKQIISTVFALGKNNLVNIKGVKEGLENKIYEAVLKTKNYRDLIDFCTSKRYTSSSIRRILFNALLGINKDYKIENMPELNYHRVLAMNQNGRKYIANLRKNKEVKPIINFARDIKKFKFKDQDFVYDVRASGIYSTQCESINANSDYLLKPYIQE